MIRHWVCWLMNYTWLYRGHGGLNFSLWYDPIIMSSRLIDFIKSLVPMFYKLGLCNKRMGQRWVWCHGNVLHLAHWWNFWISCRFELYTWRINIIYGFGFTLINWHVDMVIHRSKFRVGRLVWFKRYYEWLNSTILCH